MDARPAQLTQLDHGISAVDTDYVRPLFDASHLIVENGRAAFVDTGVNDSVPMLLDALAQQELDAGDVDYVFLTHVHLDHAGGAGLLMQSLPNARCVIHPRGARHMIDPAKLIAGATAVYGEEAMQQMYGTIEPIDESRVVIADDNETFSLAGRELTTIHTEGHARHHYCLHDPQSQGIFTGDSFGVSYRELDTANGEFIMPTTTPVQFDPDAAHASVDRLMDLQPQRCYLTHYSQVENLDRLAGDMHRGLDAYVAIAEKHADAENRTEAIERALFEYFVSGLEAHGYDGDRDRIASVVYLDVKLNTQGLEFWLNTHG